MKSIIIDIGGEKREVAFGLKVIGDCLEYTGKDLNEFIGLLVSNPFIAVPTLFYFGLKFGHEKNKKEPFPNTFEDVEEWLEADGGFGSEKIDTVVHAFNNTLYKNVPLFKTAVDNMGEEQKKTLLGTKT